MFLNPNNFFSQAHEDSVSEARPLKPASLELRVHFTTSRSTEEPPYQKGMTVYARTSPAAHSLLSPTLMTVSIRRGVGWMSCLQTSAPNPYVKYPVIDERLDRFPARLGSSLVSLFPHSACDSGNVNRNVDKIFYRGLNFSAIQYIVLFIKKKKKKRRKDK